MPDSLLLRLAIPAILLTSYSCRRQLNATTEGRPEVPVQPNACVPVEIKEYSRPCTPDDIDGQTSCYFESCPLPADAQCENGFKPGVISTAPASKICSYSEIVDL